MSEEPPEYPGPDELRKGLHVFVEQGHGEEPIEGDIGQCSARRTGRGSA